MPAEGSSRPFRTRLERAAALAILAITLAAAPPAGPAQAQAPPVAGPTADRFRAADKNGDGKIDREEFQRLIERSGPSVVVIGRPMLCLLPAPFSSIGVPA